MSRPTELRF